MFPVVIDLVLRQQKIEHHVLHLCSYISFSFMFNFLLSLANYVSNGGAKEDRTPDLLRAKQALSQLSYGPFLVGLRRFELLTSPLSGVRSNQLSYRPFS